MQNPADTLSSTPDAAKPASVSASRPYEPPAIVEDLPLETYSLACGKAAQGCGGNPAAPGMS